MDIFPMQAEDFRFMQVYKDFVRQYRDQYRENRKLPHYSCYLKNPEDNFLIFLPSQYGNDLFLGNFMNGIIYVHAETRRSSDVAPLIYQTHLFPFQNSDRNERERFFKAVRAQTPYSRLEDDFAEFHEVMVDEQLDVFNRDCVFQLQPEHYHYFLPFFKDFTPYRRLAQRIPSNGFKAIDQPRNLLL